jgi:hypothetical protein
VASLQQLLGLAATGAHPHQLLCMRPPRPRPPPTLNPPPPAPPPPTPTPPARRPPDWMSVSLGLTRMSGLPCASAASTISEGEKGGGGAQLARHHWVRTWRTRTSRARLHGLGRRVCQCRRRRVHGPPDSRGMMEWPTMFWGAIRMTTGQAGVARCGGCGRAHRQSWVMCLEACTASPSDGQVGGNHTGVGPATPAPFQQHSAPAGPPPHRHPRSPPLPPPCCPSESGLQTGAEASVQVGGDSACRLPALA